MLPIPSNSSPNGVELKHGRVHTCTGCCDRSPAADEGAAGLPTARSGGRAVVTDRDSARDRGVDSAVTQDRKAARGERDGASDRDRYGQAGRGEAVEATGAYGR